jgi:NAD(P)-dependent dehydrogenase (short-subunit alcohol dehydrogenase family)
MTKTILITGSTDGIGLLTARILAEMGHQILLHGRSTDKLEAAAAEVGGNSLSFRGDLSSLNDTVALAEDIRAKAGRVDVLINNAGVLKADKPTLPNGLDVRFVVNTLAPFVLTQKLLPIVPQDGRVINLSSAAQAPVNIKAMKGGQRLDDMGAYAQSKRAITIWTQALAQAHPQGPAFIAVNPGSLLASKMVREGFGVAGNDLRIGADILCRFALDDTATGDSGKYWDNDAERFAPVDPSQTKEVMAAILDLV